MSSDYNPLPYYHSWPGHSTQRAEIDEENPGPVMSGQDFFHRFSEISLTDHILRSHGFLLETYTDILVIRYGIDEEKEKNNEAFFRETYNNYLENVKKGTSATRCCFRLEKIFEHAFSNELNVYYCRSLVSIICADLLEKEGEYTKAWSLLLCHQYESHILTELLTYEVEVVLKREKSRKYGSQSYSRYDNLKSYFIEFLYSKAPKEGWQSQTSAAGYLAQHVLDSHNKSDKTAIYRTDLEEVNTKLKSWLRNDPKCRNAYQANSIKR
ncbi:hypothetical protein R3F64_18065 [Halomonas sp. 5021]|uniref:hypothetical protein n=1 Tax=Halomonas sp. 5021 TaxID=3082156 RepID=UPI002FC8BBB6